MDLDQFAAIAALATIISLILELFRFFVSHKTEDLEAKYRLRIILAYIFTLAILGIIVVNLSIFLAIYSPDTAANLVIRSSIFSTFLGGLLGVVWSLFIAPYIRKMMTPNK